ncbi:uncharacterized protein METZ01_LOCUS173226 [marine metagenome]|uniref:Uncharacterized protein n=1 Tax=marine metagenome TaxID=408172 RepID=A0A382C3N9_9ZZZZ
MVRQEHLNERFGTLVWTNSSPIRVRMVVLKMNNKPLLLTSH